MTTVRFLPIITLFSTRNPNLPICLNCIHFIENTNNYPYDPIPSDKQYGRCKNFGNVELVTGLIEYDFAKNCKNDINKCGKSGLKYKLII
jgi:hypothetical protein